MPLDLIADDARRVAADGGASPEAHRRGDPPAGLGSLALLVRALAAAATALPGRSRTDSASTVVVEPTSLATTPLLAPPREVD